MTRVNTVLRDMEVTNKRSKTKVHERGCLWGFGGGFKKDRTFHFKLWVLFNYIKKLILLCHKLCEGKHFHLV